MNIEQLNDETKLNSEQFSRIYKNLVMKLIRKYGYNNPQVKVELKKALKPLVAEMVKSGINLSLGFQDV